MKIHEKFMKKCLILAKLGLGKTKSNPLVGCVIVNNGKIVSEGFHEKYGGPHAEVNAINNVKDKQILSQCTLYVNLEPCSHYGKTPPCVNLIKKHKIQHVVIGTIDPFKHVNGEGIKKLLSSSKVTINILKKECIMINLKYFTNLVLKRPYIILKWAESKDKFINDTTEGIKKISSKKSTILTHKLRSQVDGIMVGTNTVICDNPQLTTRMVKGENPTRITIDIKNRFNAQKYNVLNNDAKTIVFHTGKTKTKKNIHYISVKELYNKYNNQEVLKPIMEILKNKGYNSILIEGGRQLLQNFINANLWDEIIIFKNTRMIIKEGIKAPKIKMENYYQEKIEYDVLKKMNNEKKIKLIEQSF